MRTDNPSPPPAAQPLMGMTVVELGHSVAAPFAGQTLADLGARVIKIEQPGKGDDARNWGPPFWNGTATIFLSVNRNKMSAAIDLKNEDHRNTLRRFILDEADIVIQNMRAGLVESLGLGESLRDEKPSLIYCNLAAFGRCGPYAGKPGYDPLMQAFGGIMSMTGNEGDPPVRVGVSIIDQGAGMWSVIGILSALHRRHLTGEGCVVDTSLYETALAWVNAANATYQTTSSVAGRRGSENPGLVPYKVFQASDGFLMIAAGNDNLFRRLAEALGRREWLNDERFATNPKRVENRALVNQSVQDVIITKSVAQWLAIIESAGVPVAPLQSMDQVIAHEQTQALGILQKAGDSGLTLMGLPLSFNHERPPLVSSPPELGAHDAVVMNSKFHEDDRHD